jgi:hypothetical protein
MAFSPARIAASLLVAAGLTVASVAPASAESLTIRDKRGDVLLVPADAMSLDDARPAPGMAHTDILRTVIRHGDKRVAVRIKLAELRKTRGFRLQGIRVVTNESVRRNIAVGAWPGMARGEADMSRPNGRTVNCDGLNHRIDYSRNVVTVSVPRSCLSNPRWVRVGIGTAWIKDSGDAYVDEALRAGTVSGYGPKLSPRVRRG